MLVSVTSDTSKSHREDPGHRWPHDRKHRYPAARATGGRQGKAAVHFDFTCSLAVHGMGSPYIKPEFFEKTFTSSSF